MEIFYHSSCDTQDGVVKDLRLLHHCMCVVLKKHFVLIFSKCYCYKHCPKNDYPYANIFFQIHTPDLGGHATTADMMQAIISRIDDSDYEWF